ncbi:MAG: heavy metal translocating P-type ATPase [Ardenticatenaceae bacterium]|nr:heavy metal translocating P-type ATPase [Ardenticatenaceae bacterium]MCB9445690.1 heavy metal translocating P-type ATPase [Ardenticatenaceae bacterium]
MNENKPSDEQVFHIKGLDCASCALTVEKGVARLENIDLASLNFSTETLRVRGDVAPEMVVARVRELGYDVARPEAAVRNASSVIHHASSEPVYFWRFMWERWDTRLALLGALLVLPGLLFNELLPMLGLESVFLDVTSVGAMVVAGWPIVLSAWRSVRINRDININVLMTIAAVGAVAIGAYTEAGLVMVLFAMGEALEGFAGTKARESIRSLMAVAPNEATVLRYCIDCAGHLGQDGYAGGPCPFCGLEEQRVPVADLQVGETIVVKPGEKIAMDGRILSGSSFVNQAPITGESKLAPKTVGDAVFASSINGEGALEIEVTHLAADNTISRLIQMVAEAQERRAPAQRFVDQFARIYTPAVVVLAILVAVLPPLVWGASFREWLYRALALLVVACPCALVISTPVSIISAISNGARNGVLFKGGAYLEILSRVRAVAFDKTGTLTEGKPSVVGLKSVRCEGGTDCESCNDFLALTSAVEQRSTHPLAEAVVEESSRRGVYGRYPAAENVQAMMGSGVTGRVNGREIFISSHSYFDQNIPHDIHCSAVAAADAAGYTTMLVQDGDTYAGYIAVADQVRPSSRAAVARLRSLGLAPLVMLTGDNQVAAEKIAAVVGVTDMRANCLPEDKVTAVTHLRQQYEHVAMVGDGINDAPALATASVGIAIGKTAQAMETADIVLMGDDLRQLPFAVGLSRAAMRTIWVNVGLSIGIKLAFLALILAGLGSMWLAVFADVGVSLLVTLNGMRLRKRPLPNLHSLS